MLCVWDTDEKEKMIRESFAKILMTDDLAFACSNISLVTNNSGSYWVNSLIECIQSVKRESEGWGDIKVDLFSDMIMAYNSYYKELRVMNQLIESADSRIISSILDRLIYRVKGIVSGLTDDIEKYGIWMKGMNRELPELEECIASGWNELEQAENDMLKDAYDMGILEKTISDLAGDMDSTQLSSGEWSKWAELTKNIVSLAINMAGGAISCFSAVSVIYSVGNGLKDTLQKSDELERLNLLLRSKQKKMDSDKVQLQELKALLKMLYNLQNNITSNLSISFNDIKEFWKGELRNLETLRESIRECGVRKNDLFLMQLPIAVASWEGLAATAMRYVTVYDGLRVETYDVKLGA